MTEPENARAGEGRPKLLLVAGDDGFFVSHRMPIARAARDAGFAVAVACPVTTHGDAIRAEGMRVLPIPMKRGRISPLADLRTLAALRAHLSGRAAGHRPCGRDEAGALRRRCGAARRRSGGRRRIDRVGLRVLVRRFASAAAAPARAHGASLGAERPAHHLPDPEPGRRGVRCRAGHRTGTASR